MRWDLEEGSWKERSKCWRREEVAVAAAAEAEEEAAAAAAARLRASSSSSLSSTLTSILVGFRLSISLLSVSPLNGSKFFFFFISKKLH